eukprot:4733528-Prymnesium_polylepis.1
MLSARDASLEAAELKLQVRAARPPRERARQNRSSAQTRADASASPAAHHDAPQPSRACRA